jgi:glycosyltransferase involved in cell wall biosynthesis
LIAHQNGASLFMDWCDWFGRGGSVEERPNLFVRALLCPTETFFENHYRTIADGTTVINSFLRQRAIDLGVKANKIRLIRNGSDISFQPIDRLVARRSLGLPLVDPIIGFVGGTFLKDAKFMAAAFNQVLEENPRVKLLLVGYFNRAIEKWVLNPESIIRSGPVDSVKLYTYLSTCDVCWLPLIDSGANRGRWPFKMNDYMTVARPVVATTVGEFNEIIQRYNLGITTPVDPELFAKGTLRLLGDEILAHNIGQNARQVAQNVFSWEKLTDELEAFYLINL